MCSQWPMPAACALADELLDLAAPQRGARRAAGAAGAPRRSCRARRGRRGWPSATSRAAGARRRAPAASSRARETRWIVERISVPCTTLRRSSARVSASRSKPSSRDHSPMYIDGAYCACRPPMRSSARGIESDARSSSIWRASSARLSSRSVRTRSVTARRRARRRDRPSRRPARRPSARIIWPTPKPCGTSATSHVVAARAQVVGLGGEAGLELHGAGRRGRGSARRRARPADRARRRRRGARAGSGPAPACCRP